jgi:hypothetical protein
VLVSYGVAKVEKREDRPLRYQREYIRRTYVVGTAERLALNVEAEGYATFEETPSGEESDYRELEREFERRIGWSHNDRGYT